MFQQIRIPKLAGTILIGEFLAPVLPDYDRPLLNHSSALFNSSPREARKWFFYGSPRFVVFDILAESGADVTAETYDERRVRLERVVAMILARFPGCGVELIHQMPATVTTIEGVLSMGGEGVVLKRRASAYQVGKQRPVRSPDWCKIKRYSTIDVYLTGGWKPGENSRAGTVGSVEVAVMDGAGNNVVIGDVAVKPCWVAEVTAPDGSLREQMTGTVIEVMAQGLNEFGHLRHPHMIRVRPDKSPGDCSDVQLSLLARV
jgi:ATP-dependent DNA ligase